MGVKNIKKLNPTTGRKFVYDGYVGPKEAEGVSRAYGKFPVGQYHLDGAAADIEVGAGWDVGEACRSEDSENVLKEK